MIDVGAWASESYRVPVAEARDPDEFDNEPGDSPIGRKATS
jgi:endogenous inhibitor of DNA gyrase (YacG/DUF329 family)